MDSLPWRCDISKAFLCLVASVIAAATGDFLSPTTDDDREMTDKLDSRFDFHIARLAVIMSKPASHNSNHRLSFKLMSSILTA